MKKTEVNNKSMLTGRNKTAIIVGILCVIGIVSLVLFLNNRIPLKVAITGNAVSLQDMKKEPMYFYFSDEAGQMASFVYKISYNKQNQGYEIITEFIEKPFSLKSITNKNPKYCETIKGSEDKYIFQCGNAACDFKKNSYCIKIELLQQQDIDINGKSFTDMKFKVTGSRYIKYKTFKDFAELNKEIDKYHFPEYYTTNIYTTNILLNKEPSIYKLTVGEATNKNKNDLRDYYLNSVSENSCWYGQIANYKFSEDEPFKQNTFIDRNDLLCISNRVFWWETSACGVSYISNSLFEGTFGFSENSFWPKYFGRDESDADSFYKIRPIYMAFLDSYTDYACLPTFIGIGNDQYYAYGSYVECDAKGDGGVYPKKNNGILAPKGILAETKKDIFLWNNYNKGFIPNELYFSSPSYKLKPQEYAKHLLCAPFDKYESWYICDPNNDFPKQQHGVPKKLNDKVTVGKDFYTCTINGWTTVGTPTSSTTTALGKIIKPVSLPNEGDFNGDGTITNLDIVWVQKNPQEMWTEKLKSSITNLNALIKARVGMVKPSSNKEKQ